MKTLDDRKAILHENFMKLPSERLADIREMITRGFESEFIFDNPRTYKPKTQRINRVIIEEIDDILMDRMIGALK